jgi:DNA-binding GntR family transcriptional regulator
VLFLVLLRGNRIAFATMPTKSRTPSKAAASRSNRSSDSSVAHVVEHLRHGIISGRYQRDSKILPKQIAERCGTSFIPVREALRILEAEGFILFRHNRGAWVTPVSLTDLEDLYDLRIQLETEAVAHCRPFEDSEIEKLNGLISRMSQSYERDETAKVVKLNQDFHFSIYDHCRSPRRLRMIKQLWLHAERYQQLSLQVRHDAADEEHGAIVVALTERDHEVAAEALRAHLKSTVSLLKAGWETVGRTDDMV